MPKRSRKIAQSLRKIGDIQINSWDFPDFLNKDIKDLEIHRSLRRLGQKQVTDWDFKDVLPAINKAAQIEIDIDGFIRRTANYKVNDWNFRDTIGGSKSTKVSTIIKSLSKYLEYVITQLIDEPKYLSIHAEEITPRVIRFKAVMTKRDASILIGMNGKTASPLRRLLKASAEHHGANALLEIQSHEDAQKSS